MDNILILSSGTRNKIVQYFKRTLTAANGERLGKVIATDMSHVAPSIYEADRYYIVPRITEPNYLSVIFDICKKEEISAVFSLIDPELSLLAKHEKEFAELGVKVIGSSYALCEMSINKMEMYNWLIAHEYKVAKSYLRKEELYEDLQNGLITYPVFVKPVCGSASIGISKVWDTETIELLFSKNENLMIQEYLNGQEIGADVYIDMSTGEVVSIFTKKKLCMRAGETDKAVSFKDEKLFSLIERFVKEAGYRGQVDIDIFEVDGEYYISEVNPRFGGGYPHAYECGCDHVKMIINNVRGISNVRNIGQYKDGVYMMKYGDLMIL